MSFSAFAPASGGLPPSPQDERRARILDAARTCFSRAGFHRTSMQEICAEAKMSPGGLYRYFASKDAIIEAIAHEEQCAGRRILEVLLEPGSLHDRLLRCGLSFTEAMRDRLRTYGLFSEIISWKLRFFVPADGTGPGILAKLLDTYPVARISEREAA